MLAETLDFVQKLLNGLLGALVILLCYWLGLVIANTFNLPIPGPVCGFALLLLLQISAPSIKASLTLAAKPLLSHMSIMFVPSVMGVATYWAVVETNLVSLVVAIVVTTCIALGVQAKLTDWLINNKRANKSSFKSDE